ncbi:MAG: TetR/AcrR family transcriptional regulator [Clostridia bacterium]|nr:TetR/AcrR family transcriptional regulator [Clostridia bacterium]
MNKQPEVTARTRKMFMDAFWKIFRNTPVEKIRIDALAKEAGYNRTTFYEYFEDIYDLLRQAEEELLSEYRDEMFSMFPEGMNSIGKTDIVKALVSLFDTFGDRILILTGKTGDSSFSSRLEKQAMPLMRGILGADAGEYTNYIVTFVYNAVTGVLRYWYENGRQIPEESILKLLYGMLSDGVLNTALKYVTV